MENITVPNVPLYTVGDVIRVVGISKRFRLTSGKRRRTKPMERTTATKLSLAIALVPILWTITNSYYGFVDVGTIIVVGKRFRSDPSAKNRIASP